MGRKKVRTADDARLLIDLPKMVINKLRKLMRKQGNTELKPFLENSLMEIVINAEEEGEI